MTLYEESPGYFYDDSHKKWSLFKENNGQWRLEDLANDTRSDHPSFGAAVSALKSHVGDVTVHRKQAMSQINKAVLKLAQSKPEFRKALVSELRKTSDLARLSEGTPLAVAKATMDLAKSIVQLKRDATKLKRLFKKHPVENPDDDWGRGKAAEGQLEAILKALKVWDQGPLIWSVYADSPMHRKMGALKEADKWENKPKGWTDESRKKFWDSLTSAAPKHKVTECIKRMNKHMGGNAGAFCASLADRVMPGWRQEAAKERAKKGSSLTQPLSLRRDYGAGSDQDEWLNVEEVRKHCPPCADKMAANGIRKVRASALRVAMQR